VSTDSAISQVTKPIATGSASVRWAPLRDSTAYPPIAASTAYPTAGAHQAVRDTLPRAAKTMPVTTRMPITSTGLSAWPRTSIAARAIRPGVCRITRSAMATTGDSRIDISDATR
jgi:hypothetical protein